MIRLLHALFLALLFILSTSAATAKVTVTYFHNDVSGSPMVATNEAGNVVWKESYRPYGDKLRKEPASTNGSNKIGFAGRPFDASTGLSYMGARYYDPVIGRFMGVDPKGVDPENIHSFNRYAYANNNPYKFVDPDGHSPIDVAFLIYDLGKLGVAAYTGVGVAGAAADVALSAVGVISPVPGVGQAMKAARVVEHGVGVGKSLIEVKAVTKYEVGTFDALKSKSFAGDGLDIHHAVQKNPAGQAISGYNPATAPSIAVPRGEHSRIPTLKGEYSGSARDLLAKDIRDLRGNTNASNGSLKELIDLNKQTYPGAFNK